MEILEQKKKHTKKTDQEGKGVRVCLLGHGPHAKSCLLHVAQAGNSLWAVSPQRNVVEKSYFRKGDLQM